MPGVGQLCLCAAYAQVSEIRLFVSCKACIDYIHIKLTCWMILVSEGRRRCDIHSSLISTLRSCISTRFIICINASCGHRYSYGRYNSLLYQHLGFLVEPTVTRYLGGIRWRQKLATCGKPAFDDRQASGISFNVINQGWCAEDVPYLSEFPWPVYCTVCFLVPCTNLISVPRWCHNTSADASSFALYASSANGTHGAPCAASWAVCSLGPWSQRHHERSTGQQLRGDAESAGRIWGRESLAAEVAKINQGMANSLKQVTYVYSL